MKTIHDSVTGRFLETQGKLQRVLPRQGLFEEILLKTEKKQSGISAPFIPLKRIWAAAAILVVLAGLNIYAVLRYTMQKPSYKDDPVEQIIMQYNMNDDPYKI